MTEGKKMATTEKKILTERLWVSDNGADDLQDLILQERREMYLL